MVLARQSHNASDSSGNGNHGVLTNGPVWQPTGGYIGGALLFDGSNDKVILPSTAGVDVDGTVTVWVNCTPSGYGEYIWYDHETNSDSSVNISPICITRCR